MTPERVFIALLCLYPRRFRQQYGEPMLDAFRAALRDNHRALPRFWLFIISDVGRSAGLEHLRELGSILWPLLLRCALLCLAWIAFGFSSAGQYVHFNDDGRLGFLDAWIYGGLIGLGLGAAQARILRRRLGLGVPVWILVTAGGSALGAQYAWSLLPEFGIYESFLTQLSYGFVWGSCIGLAQWAVIRRHVSSGGWWILASATATATATFCFGGLSLAITGLYAASGSGLVFSLIVGSAIIGMATGAVTAKPLSFLLMQAPFPHTTQTVLQ